MKKNNSTTTFTKGQKVSFIPHDKAEPEPGKVKSLHKDGVHAYVVYHCSGNWDRYELYTGQLTPLKSLVPGWPIEE